MPKSNPAPTSPMRSSSSRNRRATERAQYVDDDLASKASQRKEKERRKAEKDAERAAYQQRENITQPISSAAPVGADPLFSSQVVTAPAVKHLSLVARKSVVPPSTQKNLGSGTLQACATKPHRLTPEKAAELLRLHKAHAGQSDGNDASRRLQALQTPLPAYSQSPTDGEIFDEAIQGLTGWSMDTHIGTWPHVTDSDIEREANGYYEDNGDDDDDIDDDIDQDDNRSPSPEPGSKRRHSHIKDDGDDDDEPPRQAVKINASNGRPKAADYEPSVRAILSTAWKKYRGHLSTDTPYPDAMLEITWAKAAWNESCEELHTPIIYNSEILKMITARGSHLRGEAKTKLRPYIPGEYGFQTSNKQSIIDKNVAIYRKLKDDFTFYYKSRGANGNEGIYGAGIIQQGVNVIFFNDKKDEGVLFPEFYKPFPEVALALILTAIECCIDEWNTGSQILKKFTSEEYSTIFDEHMRNLTDFDLHTKEYGLLPKLLSRLYDNGRIHAKADPIGEQSGRTISSTAFAAAIAAYKTTTHASESDAEE
ncbi:hypothetical protein HWV62_29668 [Athelia sp. TMB]|nr:hypothetical protein HWV62_29668 [Athelia sp. TMB]